MVCAQYAQECPADNKGQGEVQRVISSQSLQIMPLPRVTRPITGRKRCSAAVHTRNYARNHQIQPNLFLSGAWIRSLPPYISKLATSGLNFLGDGCLPGYRYRHCH